MESKNKLFAFKLAAREDAKNDTRVDAKDGKWKARDGAPIAGCTDPKHTGDFRYPSTFSSDSGVWC